MFPASGPKMAELWAKYKRLTRNYRTFRVEHLGQEALYLISHIWFTLFVLGVLVFTIIAAKYEPEDPLFHPSTKMTTFLTSTSDATFASDVSVVKTGEDFMQSNQTIFDTAVNMTDVETLKDDILKTPETTSKIDDGFATCQGQINCSDPELFYQMMIFTIRNFEEINFYKFGKPVTGAGDATCDMAWRFRPREGKTASFYKDFRRFEISKKNCSYIVDSIGEYHSGVNAKKMKISKSNADKKEKLLPLVGETVNDSLPVVESENSFALEKYLIYSGGGDKCKSMNHFIWSFLCSLGEAQYLNRTLVMDLSLCLNSMYTSSNKDEEGKDFRFYFDFEHLKESAKVLDQSQFWAEWGKWYRVHNMKLFLVEDFRVTPMKLAGVKDSLILRKFGSKEPDNFWYRVCEGETESVVQRPWDSLWKSKRLMDIVSVISARLNWDYDAVHVERGDKARNSDTWPNLNNDTSPGALLAKLGKKVKGGRDLYVASNEEGKGYFDPLKNKYKTHFIEDYADLWAKGSDWYDETMELNKGLPVEFDGYMKASVDTEVFLRGKKQIETFNDLTSDCKDGINTCNVASS